MLNRIIRSAAVMVALLVPALTQAQSCTANITQAQTCTVGATASLTIPTLVALTLSSTTVTFDASAITDLNAAADITQPLTATVRSNAAWSLTLAANTAFWTVGGNPSLRPASSLEWSNGGAFSGSTTGGASVASGTRTNSGAVNLNLRATIPADYGSDLNIPGAYSLGLTFTLTSP